LDHTSVSPKQIRKTSSHGKKVTSPYFRNKSSRYRRNPDRKFTSPYLKRKLSCKFKTCSKLGLRGAHVGIEYVPPKSPYNLIQEGLYKKPWQLLIATIFLHKTTGTVAIPLFNAFISKYDTPEQVISADWKEIAELIKPMGLHEKRAKIIITFSEEYLNKDWEHPIELHGIGKYGDDSYRIFCLGEWKTVKPSDHKLNWYYDWISEQDRLGLLA